MKVYIKSATTESEIAQFIGQPIWVKYACFNDFNYVKIISIDEAADTLTFEFLPAHKLDALWLDKDCLSWRLTNPHKVRTTTPGSFFKNYTMVHPVELITDEEIQYMVFSEE